MSLHTQLFFLAPLFCLGSHATHIFAFGDSYSDGGERATLSAALASRELMSLDSPPPFTQWYPAHPNSPYYLLGNGRWTNGPTAVEYIATELGAALSNYAVGGATTGMSNYCAWMDTLHQTGLLGQVQRFLAEPHSMTDDSIFFIFASANDYFKAEDNHWEQHQTPISSTQMLSLLAQTSVDNIVTAINTLARAGANRFLVVGSTDLSVVPWESTYKRVADATHFVEVFNMFLSDAIKKLSEQNGLKIAIFDHVALSNEIRAHPSRHGFTQIDKPCTLSQIVNADICSDPDVHYFWDEYHPTTRFHKLAGDAMLKAVMRLMHRS